MLTLTFLYVVLVIIYVIWIYFGESLINVQRWHQKLLLEYKWEDPKLFFLRTCALSSVLIGTNFRFPPRSLIPKGQLKIYRLLGYTFSRKNQNVGFVSVGEEFTTVTLASTSNLSDVFFSMYNNLIDIEEGCIHEGYYKHSLEIFPNLMKIIHLQPNKNIVLTGHSLGGVLASILGYMLSRYNFKVNVHTFGSPKFANNQLKHFIEKIENLKIVNVVNTADAVTKKPSNWKYTRVGDTIEGRIDTGNDNVNHGIKVYREILLGVEKTKIGKRGHRIDEILGRWFLDILG